MNLTERNKLKEMVYTYVQNGCVQRQFLDTIDNMYLETIKNAYDERFSNDELAKIYAEKK